MAADSQIEFRISRLENDRDAIYEILGDIRATLHEHTQLFVEMGRRFDKIESTLVAHGRRFDTIDATLGEILQRLPAA
jgi:hypothetical protein